MKHACISVPFELKSLLDTGEFTGIASPYGVKDLGNDIVDSGAFTKTIAERGNKVRLLDGHEIRIGIAAVSETEKALEANGHINLDKQAGRDAYSDLKFYRDQGLPMGLSIGYETLQSDRGKDGIRHLKELRLWEISITEFPMSESALVSSVKNARRKGSKVEQKMDFMEALDNIETWKAQYNYMCALDISLCDAIHDEDMNTADAVYQSQFAIQQFAEQMKELVPKLRDLMKVTYGYNFKKMFEVERKAGRRISAASRTKIEEAISQLKTLLEEEAAAAEADDAAAKAATIVTELEVKATPEPETPIPAITPGTSPEAAATATPGTSPEAAAEPAEPGKSHSADEEKILASLSNRFESIRSLIPA